MPDEQQTPSTEPQVAEPQAAATPTVEEPKPEVTKPEEPDYRAAYVGLQRTVNKLHTRNEDLQRQNVEIAEALKSVKETTKLLATQSLGPEQMQALEARQHFQAERAAALQAAQRAEQFIATQTSVFLDTLKAAGINPDDPELDWGKDARDVQEWGERIGASVQRKLAKTIEAKLKEAEGKVSAKQSAEIKAEAEALAQRQLKESGVDHIDTAKGSAPTRLADRIRDMDPNSDEFKKFYSDVLAGRPIK